MLLSFSIVEIWYYFGEFCFSDIFKRKYCMQFELFILFLILILYLDIWKILLLKLTEQLYVYRRVLFRKK